MAILQEEGRSACRVVERRLWGRLRRRRRGRGRRLGHDLLDFSRGAGLVKPGPAKDVFPPEREEELDVSSGDALGRGSWRGGDGELGHGGDHRCPVGE